jgi:hypothetical protein
MTCDAMDRDRSIVVGTSSAKFLRNAEVLQRRLRD